MLSLARVHALNALILTRAALAVGEHTLAGLDPSDPAYACQCEHIGILAVEWAGAVEGAIAVGWKPARLLELAVDAADRTATELSKPTPARDWSWIPAL